MKLEFVYLPVTGIAEALGLYRDGLGLTEAWREGEQTVALEVPGSEVKLMLDTAAPGSTPGPVLVVESVATFRAEHPSLDFAESLEIPGGWLTTFTDPWSNVVYVMDQSTADAP